MKPGYLTTEFWLTIAANVLVQTNTLDVPERYKWLVTLATVAGYALSRGLAKTNPAAIDLSGLGFDPELDDPSFTSNEPREPAPVIANNVISAGWEATARAAGWSPPPAGGA